MKATEYATDFYADAFIMDPIPHYAEMRAAGPVVCLPENKCYAVARYNEVVEVLRGADRFISGRGLSLNDAVNKLLIGNSLNSDSPDHERRRAITAVPIMPKNIAPLETYIKDTAQGLAEALVALGRFDAVDDFATVLPLAIVVDLVGLSDEGKGEMLKWASAAFNLFEGFNARSHAAFDDLKGLQDYLAEHGRRDALKEGGLAQRIFDVAPEKGFSQDEAAQLMRDYINPSLDTTVSAAGFAAYYFSRFPDQWDRLRDDPDLIPNAVEEIVRMATPIRAFSRYVAQDTEISEVQIEKGARIIAVYASANRDETVWDNPDRFDVSRRVRKHLGFGHGKHTCMGLHLARRELINLIDAMRSRVKRWELDGEPEVAMNNTIRAFAHLPVRVIPA
ncbi:cytochrome P450 [Sulfitobacter aestuariivivens]|uniref:Cytochrome P450 n=1 Tax=Sulfitobacter aestuariivivens TaxID=2766981 RepID=A0A927D8C0_9RHOB|nr:cytochrome P450 [Sulfitobacter aestuariivivens]MBD3666291.1 cytochrome P450 [Sulfitobacter aestuariivivens]